MLILKGVSCLSISESLAAVIARNIKKARLNAGLTQDQLAKKMGISKNTISGYENGVSMPKVEFLYPLMDALNVDANYIYGVDSTEVSMNLTLHECELISAYRSQQEAVQQSIDRILQIDSEASLETKSSPHAYGAKDA